MVRSGVPRALHAAALLLGVALPGTALAAARALPPAELAAAGLGWLIPVLAASLVALLSAATVACLVAGLRDGTLAALLGASGSAAVGGGALALALTGTPHGLVAALPVAGAMLVAIGATERRNALLARRRSRVAVAASGLLLAEAAVLAGVLPAAATTVGAWDVPLLLAAAVAAGVAAVAARGGWLAAAGAGTAIGAAGLLLDRSGGLELLIGLLGLVAAALAGLGAVANRPAPAAEPDVTAELPPLADHLADPVLYFDGGLGLRDWNPAAAAMLGVDTRSRGMRLEDLLGVPIAELPAEGGRTVATTAVDGLEIGLHRSGDGVVAVVAAGVSRADEDRLGRELRGTIEELLQARRTIELQRAEIERSAAVDLLTGVASRAAILDRLRTEIAQARRYQHPVAVVLLDVDGFADVNHRHGVSGGDTLLREVALRMRLRVREADALGRAGSDGFLAVLPHTDEAGAATFAAALRHRLAQRPVPVGDELVPLTVSIGVAVMRAGEELDLDGVLARVGEALDSARTAGGDRIALDRDHGFVRLTAERDRPDPDREEKAT